MMLLDRMEAAEFLGSEFLTWLYWRVARNDGGGLDIIDVSESGSLYAPATCTQIIVSLARAVALADREAKEKVTVSEKNPAVSSEVRHALRQGKTITQVRVVLKWATKPRADQPAEWREFECTIKARTLALSGVVLPTDLDHGGRSYDRYEDQIVAEKALLMAELDGLVLALYRTFLDARQSEDWRDVLDEIRKWIGASSNDTLASSALTRLREEVRSGRMTITVGGSDA